MARYKAKAKTKAKNKSLIAVVIVILVAVLVVAASIGSLGFTKKNFKTWFNNWGKPAASTQSEAQTWGGVIDNVGNEMNSETTYAMPTAMAFYATRDVAQNTSLDAPSVTVTCSHNFEFNNVFVDWSIEYPSGASAVDVVTVTPTGDGSLTANVSCSAPFDTQLTLKATLRGNTEKIATCTIDYVKRIQNFNTLCINGSDFNDVSGISCNPVFGIGTVKGNLNVKKVTYDISSEFKADVQSYLKFNITFKSYTTVNLLLDENYSADGESWEYGMFIQNFENYDNAHKNAIYYAWNAAFFNNRSYSNRGNILLDIEIELLYNGKFIQNFTETEYIGAGSSPNYLTGECYGYDLAPDLTLNTNVAL